MHQSCSQEGSLFYFKIFVVEKDHLVFTNCTIHRSTKCLFSSAGGKINSGRTDLNKNINGIGIIWETPQPLVVARSQLSCQSAACFIANDFAVGKIILVRGKIILGGAIIILASGKMILAGLVTTRQSHPVRARKFLNNGMWGVYSPGLVTTRRSS